MHFGGTRRRIDAPLPPLGALRKPDVGPNPIFQTVSPRTRVNRAVGLQVVAQQVLELPRYRKRPHRAHVPHRATVNVHVG